MNLSLKVQPAQLVSRHDHKITTTSTIIADAFQKPHNDLLKAIRALECSEDFRSGNFFAYPYQHPQNKQTYTAYEITKDGFMFLVMGFTGAKAAAWKETFIDAFNVMQDQLSTEVQLPSQQLCEYKDQIITLQSKVIDLSEELAMARLPAKRTPRTKSAPLNDTERDLIIALSEKGHAGNAIARQLGRSSGLISMFLSGYKAAKEQETAEVRHA
ncbi:MAG: Rha family transcriptional regulator [Thiomicrospira sp.]